MRPKSKSFHQNKEKWEREGSFQWTVDGAWCCEMPHQGHVVVSFVETGRWERLPVGIEVLRGGGCRLRQACRLTYLNGCLARQERTGKASPNLDGVDWQLNLSNFFSWQWPYFKTLMMPISESLIHSSITKSLHWHHNPSWCFVFPATCIT